MRVEVIPGKELTPDLAARWSEIQRSSLELASPFFCAQFLRAVAAVRDDVQVGVLQEGNRIVGFFPFQRQWLGIAGPVGGHLSDYQGLVVDKEVDWDAAELVQKCGISIWNFDHLLASQKAFAPFHTVTAESPVLDLSGGYDAYVQELRQRGSRQFQELARKCRKLEREVGPVRFEAHLEDREVLRQVIAWKKMQCKETGSIDVFCFPWTLHLVERILATQEDGFGGMLSVLFAGDHLVAAHMGMRSRSVWHWWFPTYNHDFAKYSPGLIFLTKIAEATGALGLDVIDLGKGKDSYKELFQNGAVPLAEGRIMVPSTSASIVNLQEVLEQWVRRSTFASAAKVPGRALRRIVKKTSRR
jgi:CelD/BcsL family acetyltransferase involved in cellulose biosynthesis